VDNKPAQKGEVSVKRPFTRLEARLQPNIGLTLLRVLAVFMRLSITPPKVNRFGWNLEHSEYIVELALADFGCDPRSSDSWRASDFQDQLHTPSLLECEFSYRCARFKKISTDIEHAVVPRTLEHCHWCHMCLRWLCFLLHFSERGLAFTFAICYRRSVCLSSVCL